MYRHTRTVIVAILSVAALFLVAFAGSATAAKLITGKDIKNGSITGKDVKNSSITGKDVKKGSLSASKLANSAKTSVRFAEDSSSGVDLPTCGDTALDDCLNLLAVGMTPGSYVVTASGSLDNLSGVTPAISNRCGLYRGTENVNETRFALAPNTQPGEVQSFGLHQVIKSTSSAPVSLRCTEMPGESLRLNDFRLTVLKVGSIG